jgi:hypothetical protein
MTLTLEYARNASTTGQIQKEILWVDNQPASTVYSGSLKLKRPRPNSLLEDWTSTNLTLEPGSSLYAEVAAHESLSFYANLGAFADLHQQLLPDSRPVTLEQSRRLTQVLLDRKLVKRLV